jgi:subtilisin family serine protease
MTSLPRLATPWARRSQLYAAPGALVVKLALGEAPPAIPATRDVRIGAAEASERFGVHRVDAILRHFSPDTRIARVHGAAETVGFPGAGATAFDDIEQLTGLARTFRVHLRHDVSVTDAVDALRGLAVVEDASPHYLCMLPFAAGESVALDLDAAWAPRELIGAAEAMAYARGDPAIVIAILDTGVASGHPELREHLRQGFDTVDIADDDVSTGIEFVGDRSGRDTDPDDGVGHGTACAGIIGALGERIPPGLAGDCTLLPMRVLGAARVPGKRQPIGVGALVDIDEGVKLCIDLGAKVLNMSFGTPASALGPLDPIPHADVVGYGAARGCIMVAASGNTGDAERMSPACLDGVIAVAAVDGDGAPAPFCTSGDHVALAAPGVRIASPSLDGYQLATGTSFAAPFVAATAGLMASRALARSHPLDGASVERLLRATAHPWPRGERGYGDGILDAAAALRALDREIDGGDATHSQAGDRPATDARWTDR